MLKIETATRFKIVLSVVIALIIFGSWTTRHIVEATEVSQPIPNAEINAVIPRSKIKVVPLEKEDIIVLSNGEKIPGKTSELRVIEIKYLDAKEKMPVRIVSIRRQ